MIVRTDERGFPVRSPCGCFNWVPHTDYGDCARLQNPSLIGRTNRKFEVWGPHDPPTEIDFERWQEEADHRREWEENR